MEDIDPKKESFDMVVFDGASNVQKAGQVIAARFPKLIVCKWTEHVGSLLLTKAFKEGPLELLKTCTSIVSLNFVLYFMFLFVVDYKDGEINESDVDEEGKEDDGSVVDDI